MSSNKRRKGLNVTNPIINAEYVIELEKIGHTEPVEFASIKNGGYFYTHRSCASRSFGVGHGDAQQPGGGRGAGLKQNELLLLAPRGEPSVQDVLSKIVLLPVHRRGRWHYHGT
ncbi:uncharacterized protein LOC120421140 [Culex pipiens pallens]|uniref:uncharacterized protein LOC120421140 n=1 Tax=Culex pipiens pallens TaxID=42434 RepID=UPI0019547844|nr:uncharacterized protein LOC120421140 [Culex pipiens pallens]